MSNLKMISVSIVTILLLGLTSLNSYAKDPSELVEAFCYALQVSMFCDDLKMRVDTEGKVEKQVGAKIRGPRYCQMLCTALGSDPIYFNTVNKFYSFNYHR